MKSKAKSRKRSKAPTLGELVAMRSKNTQADDSETVFEPTRPTWEPKIVSKRSNKSAPREISSKRPVPVGRDRCLGIGERDTKQRSLRNFDPRFEDHCGELLEDHIERNYEFLTGLRESRRQRLLRDLKKGTDANDAEKELQRMEQEDRRREAAHRRRDVLKQVRSEEKEAVKQGKKPFFLKEKDIRNLELKAKFEDLRKNGTVQKYIEKRRKKLAGKDRKLLPQRRGMKE